MDANYTDKVTAFDALFTTNHIQMLKILLPCLKYGMQKQLAVYIKWLELQYTLDFFQRNPHAELPPFGQGFGQGTGAPGSAVDICSELLPLCSPEEKEKVQNIINMYKNFENVQEMMQIFEMMKDISPDMSSGPDGMDIAQTMEMLQNMFS